MPGGPAAAPGPPPKAKPAGAPGFDFNPRTASILCYVPVLGWIPSIVVLASPKFRTDKETRFHAFQGLYLFVAWLLVDWVVKPIFAISGLRELGFPGFMHTMVFEGLLKALLLGVWIFMLVKTSQNETYRLPVIGELAQRSVSEK
jgi:uncharacterized membrane protein